MQIAALIPVKGFSNAKQRLGGLLSRAGREVLAEAMFRDVLRAVLSARGLKARFVVTGDKDVAAIASAAGAEVIRESSEQGETSAVDFARARLKDDCWEAVLIIPGDMPLMRAVDIELVLAQVPADARAPFALLVPSHDRLGTNGLLLAPPDVIQLRFGYDSFSFHMNQLTMHRLPARFCENERIALDIDEPKDLERFLSYGVEDGETIKALRRVMAEADLWQTRSSGSV